MRKPFRLIIAAFAVMMLIPLFWLILHHPQPIFNGQPIDFWIRSLAGPNSDSAKNALTGIGLPALPYLTDALEKNRSPAIQTYATVWSKAPDPVKKFIPTPFPWEMIQLSVMNVIGSIGNDYRFSSGYNRASTPPELKYAIRALARDLSDTNMWTRISSAQSLAFIGPDSRQAVPALLEMYRRGDSNDKEMACQALGTIGPNARAPDTVQLLMPGLHDRELSTSIADALGGIGAQAAPAIPALVHEFTNGHPVSVRLPALRAIARIGNVPPELRGNLVPLLDDPSHFVRAPAAVALLRINPQDLDAVIVVRQCLGSPQNNIRSSTVYLIMNSKDLAKLFEPELDKLQNDGDFNVSAFARHALMQIERPAKTASR